MTTSVEFDHLILKQATIEIRFNDAYLLWDRAGFIWSEANSKFPNMKPVTVTPNEVKFMSDNRFEFSLNLDKAHIIDTRPSPSLKELQEHAEYFIDLVTDSLSLNIFSRIGFRLIYQKNFPDKLMAASALLSKKIISAPDDKLFNIKGSASMPRYSIVWEGETAATKVTIAAQNKKIDFDGLSGVDEIPSVHIEKSEIIYDIDYYTLKNISKGQFNTKDWIQQIYHIIKRDSRSFLSK